MADGGVRAAAPSDAAHRCALDIAPRRPADANPDRSIRAGLQQFGWAIQQNLQVEYRWASGAEQVRQSARELLALAPDAILANGAIAIGPLQQLTTTVPIVIVGVVDPVGAGYVRSLARPGGNITGFTNFEYSLSAKWPELLKQIAPAVTRAAVLRDPSVATGSGQFGVVQAIGRAVTALCRRVQG